MELTSLLMYSLNAPTWTARKLDKRVTSQAKVANGVSDSTDAGNFNKLILPDCDELKAVASWIGGTRSWFYLHTAPWGEARGVRVGKAENHMELMTDFGDKEAGLEPLLDAFEAVYPGKIATMRETLRDMFDPNDYPAWEHVRARFALRLAVQPLPNANDVRVLTEIPAHVRAEIEASLKEEQEKVYNASISHAFTELLTPVQHMAKQLKAYTDGDVKKIYDSLIENVRNMGAAAQRLNIARDPRIDALAAEAVSLVDGVTRKDLKDSDMFRLERQRKAEALAARIAVLIPN
jgi:hypothetical protein